MKAQHTPGPWRTSDCGDWSASHDGLGSSCYQGIKDARGNVVALAVAHHPKAFSEPDTEANARLIAAAPYLLSALQSLHAAMACYDSTPEEFLALASARKAIDEATGQP
jgi:hypothetical protein